MILLQVSEIIKNVFKKNIWEGKRKLENVFDIRDYIPREKTNYDTSGNFETLALTVMSYESKKNAPF